MRHFIWAISVCQTTCLGVSRPQRFNKYRLVAGRVYLSVTVGWDLAGCTIYIDFFK